MARTLVEIDTFLRERESTTNCTVGMSLSVAYRLIRLEISEFAGLEQCKMNANQEIQALLLKQSINGGRD